MSIARKYELTAIGGRANAVTMPAGLLRGDQHCVNHTMWFVAAPVSSPDSCKGLKTRNWRGS